MIPLRGGPLDGKTVPADSVHRGRYTEHRIAEAPRVTFDPGHDPTGPIEEAPLPRETVVYELRGVLLLASAYRHRPGWRTGWEA